MSKTKGRDLAVRCASAADANAIGQLLHDFNREYDDPTPSASVLAERIGQLLGAADTVVLVGGPGPDGLVVLRFRPDIWSEGLECYLAELYVVSGRRGQGLGRALMEAAIDQARDHGADHMDLGTSEDDVAARALYESLGFTNRDGGFRRAGQLLLRKRAIRTDWPDRRALPGRLPVPAVSQPAQIWMIWSNRPPSSRLCVAAPDSAIRSVCPAADGVLVGGQVVT